MAGVDLPPIDPGFHPGQVEVARSKARFRVLAAGRRWGKALALDTPIPTPTGWTTMGALQDGDLVLDEHGRPTPVLVVWAVRENRPCYRVVFSDGAEIIADADHEWYAWDKSARKAKTRAARPRALPRSVTTAEMAEKVLCPRPDGRTERNWAIPWHDGLGLPEASLPVDPYLLGVWLGDGASAGAQITTADPEIVEAFRAQGWIVKPHKSSPYGWYVTHPAGRKRSPLGAFTANGSFKNQLRDAGVLGNKHIPAAYLRASWSQRLGLLRGLMDTDGYVKPGIAVAEFTTTNAPLAAGTVELVRTLGMEPRIYCGRATLYGRDCGPKWRIVFRPFLAVTALPRKAHRVTGRRLRYVAAVEPVPSVPVRCITVASSSGLFLAGEAMIPTHNSRLGVWECLRVASEGGRAWWVAPTYPLANEGWRPLRSMAHQWPGATVREVDKEVGLPGGGLVQVRSADEPHRLRGAGLDFVVIDEAAFCKKETWLDALRPALPDRLGRALLISTPKGDNWFRDLWEKAGKRDDWARWQYPTVSNPFIPAGEVESAALELPSLV